MRIKRATSRRWARPIIAGTLIAASFAASSLNAAALGDWLFLAAAAVAGLPIVLAALRAVRLKIVGIDMLVSVAAIGAILISNYWEAAAVTFLFAIGNSLEQATLGKTRAALSELISQAPDVAVVIRDGHQVEIPARDVIVGETVILKTGARVPVDGKVISGAGSVDQQSITGESVPEEKLIDDEVFAGTIVATGFLQVEALRVGRGTTLARIIQRVEEAQNAKAPTQVFMDKFSRWYTPGIILLAAVGGLVTGDIVLALTLLVIGCPGALVISIPVAVVAGIGRGARDGVLIKGGEYLELAARVDAVALDKTGTLTAGKPTLVTVEGLNGFPPDAVLSWAARVEAASDHPLAAPILAGARAASVDLSDLPHEVETIVGIGVRGQVQGHDVAVGNHKLNRSIPVDADSWAAAEARMRELSSAGQTPMAVLLDGEAIGVIGVADELRPEAAVMVQDLHRLGISRVAMLTGDRQEVAAAISQSIGVDLVHAELMPEDKLTIVQGWQREGRVVAMLGDGVNDAPALATAHIGIAMGAAGSAVALETADIALMADRLDRLPHALRLARRTVRVMRQNISIALLTVAVLLVGVFMGGVTMSIGMLVHEASVLVVIANAMRLLRAAKQADVTYQGRSSIPKGLVMH